MAPLLPIIVNFKKLHPDAVIPKYAKEGDAGMDMVAVSKEFDETSGCIVYGTGLACEIPPNYVGLIFPRSSIYKQPLSLANCVGVIDSGYRGEIKAMFRREGRPRKCYNPGDRIMQMIVMPFPRVQTLEVKELSDTERGEGGFGSSGK